MKRGARRKTLRMTQNPDSVQQTEGMTKVTNDDAEKTVKESSSNQVSPLDVNESPMMEDMIERKGGDAFLYENNPDLNQNNNQQETTTQEIPQNNQQTTNNGNPSANIQSPKEFSFDPTIQNQGPGVEDDSKEIPASSEAPTNPIPAEVSDESSRMIAEMLLEGFGMIAPEMADRYSKINEGQIRKLEQDDKIQSGLVEIAKTTNKNNKNAVKVTNEQKNLIRKPLIKVLEVQGVKASPESMLVIAIIAVCVMLFIQARSIKKENDDMVKSWMADHSKSKRLSTENDKLRAELDEIKSQRNRPPAKEVEYATVEEVN